jgi:hypothetical protein
VAAADTRKQARRKLLVAYAKNKNSYSIRACSAAFFLDPRAAGGRGGLGSNVGVASVCGMCPKNNQFV